MTPTHNNTEQFHKFMDGQRVPDPTHGPCGVRCLEAAAVREADRYVIVGLVMGGYALCLLAGILIGNGTVARWLS